jgi:hypothetical protein
MIYTMDELRASSFPSELYARFAVYRFMEVNDWRFAPNSTYTNAPFYLLDSQDNEHYAEPVLHADVWKINID